MRLYKNTTSPYARLVSVVAAEWGLAVRIETVDVDPWNERDRLVAVNPTAKVPALVTDGGVLIVESGTICDYLADLAGGGAVGAKDAEYFHRLGLARAAMDCAFGAFLQRREASGADTALAARWRQAITAIAGALDPSAAARHRAAQPDLADLTAAAAYLYVDFRLSEVPWRRSASELATLVDALAARPAFRSS